MSWKDLDRNQKIKKIIEKYKSLGKFNWDGNKGFGYKTHADIDEIAKDLNIEGVDE